MSSGQHFAPDWRTSGFRCIGALLPVALAGILARCSDASKPSSDAACSPIDFQAAGVPAGVLMALHGLGDTGVPGRQNAYQRAGNLPASQPGKALFRPVEARKPSEVCR